MFVKTINIAREGAYSFSPCDPTKPLVAKITVEGDKSETTLTLGVDASKRIVALIADEVAAAGREVAAKMTAEAVAASAEPIKIQKK